MGPFFSSLRKFPFPRYNLGMRALLPCLLFFISFKTLAVPCSGSSEINLTSPGSSLEKLRITDQNGLGICHIEQLHKMLQAAIPGNPDLSRVQLAIMEKKIRDQELENKKAVRWMKNSIVGGVYIDAGNSCEAFDFIQGQEICLAEHDRFEQLTKNNPDDQMNIIGKLSVYFDHRNKNRSNGMDILFLESPDALNGAIQACKADKDSYQQFIQRYTSHLKENESVYGKKFVRNTLKAITPLKQNVFTLNSQDFLSGKSYVAHLEEKFPRISEIADGTFLNEGLLELKKTEQCVFESLKNAAPLCRVPGSPVNDIVKLTDLGMSIHEITKILIGSSDRDKFFSEAFACEGTKIKIPPMRCNLEHLMPLAKEAKDLESYQQLVTAKLDAQLAKGTPIGISVCTRFFHHPQVKTFKVGSNKFSCGDTKDPDYKKGEASHAVTIIGSRCVNNKKEYLIQNSWGDGCFYSRSYECTRAGGFWAPADSIINNTRNLNYLEKP